MLHIEQWFIGSVLKSYLVWLFVNVHLYTQNHKIAIFEPPYVGIRGNISTLSECFNAKKLSSRVLSEECQFHS